MGELDHKDKKKAEQAEHKRRADAEDQADAAAAGATLLPWDADVESFMRELELKLNSLQTAMTSTEFRTIVGMYRELSVAQRRAVANRLQRKRMTNLLRALHRGDFSLYSETWETDAQLLQAAGDLPRPGDAPKRG
jgi:hypothetical protein